MSACVCCANIRLELKLRKAYISQEENWAKGILTLFTGEWFEWKLDASLLWRILVLDCFHCQLEFFEKVEYKFSLWLKLTIVKSTWQNFVVNHPEPVVTVQIYIRILHIQVMNISNIQLKYGYFMCTFQFNKCHHKSTGKVKRFDSLRLIHSSP